MVYEIRQMTEEDTRLAWEWAGKEGWNPGLNDWKLMPAIDPCGCFAGILDGNMISSISAVQYQGKYGFIGLYIVAREYRGRGYGHAIWQHALNYLNHEVGVECIGLDSVLVNEALYQKSGFSTSYRMYRYGCIVGGVFKRQYPEIEEEHFSDIAGYDLKVFKVGRVAFLHDFIFQSGAKTAVAYRSGKLGGFAVARPCFNGYKIGPLFADDIEVARTLLASIFNSLPGQTVFIEVPESNPSAMRLVADFDMVSELATFRMYTGDRYQLDPRYFYGVTSRVVG